MSKKGMLSRLSSGIYHIIPSLEDPATYTPTHLQVAKYFMLGKPYYIGYVSALEFHGLSVPSSDCTMVVADKQYNSPLRRFGGSTCRIITHSATRFFGFASYWINSEEQVMVSDLEKAVVDSATHLELSGGIIGLGAVMCQVIKRIDQDRLSHYFTRNQSYSAKKRFLYLSKLLGLKWNPEFERMYEELGTSITLLDPTSPDQGIVQLKFGLKINVDPVQIRKKIMLQINA